MVGRDQYGYIKGPYYVPPGERNNVESKKIHKLGRFPKLRATCAAGKAFSQISAGSEQQWVCVSPPCVPRISGHVQVLYNAARLVPMDCTNIVNPPGMAAYHKPA